MIKMKPILFSTPMVQAILDGRKTMTRRIIKSKHESGLLRVCKRLSDGLVTEITSLDWDERPKNDCTNDIHPKYKSGDILWVRETWADLYADIKDVDSFYVYKADLSNPDQNGPITWKPSIFMPRQACRIFLEVTDVRAEKLGDISEDDSMAEGVIQNPDGSWYDYLNPDRIWQDAAKPSFISLWLSINGDWNPDQWVWVYSFKSIDQPE